MKITWWKGVFVADSLPGDRATLGRAGFELHEPTTCEEPHRCRACRAKIGRRFWSNRVEDATRLKQHCTPKAIAVMRQHLDVLARSRAVDADISVPAPPGREYRPFQKAGIAYALQHKDTLIGDEMGLGKTIQGLGFMNVTRPRSVLVICPATLMLNWAAEAEQWLCDRYEIVIPGSGNEEVPTIDPSRNLMVVTNYEKVIGRVVKGERRDTPLTRSLARVWDLGIFDEVQCLSNPDAHRTQTVFGESGLFHRCMRTVSLTGTPMSNYPKEIWPLARTICPAKFGDWWTFARRYCGLHKEEHGERTTWVDTGHSHLAELQQRLRATFMVRRLKADVLKELPPKQRQLVVLDDHDVDWSSHPALQKWRASQDDKLDAALEALAAVQTEAEYRKAVKELDSLGGVAFEEMSAVRHETALIKVKPCLRFTDTLLDGGLESLVIYAHHRDVLQQIMEHYGDQACCIYGDTEIEDRMPIVREFQSGRKRIVVVGLKAAGAGITLHRASTGVFFETDWNPAVVKQAEDRMHRIGQMRAVNIIHPVLNGTLDANMVKKMIAKQDVVDKALDWLPEQVRRQQLSLPIR